MGQKVHPVGFRLGVTKDWQAKWYADRHYTELLQEDLKIRGAIERKYPEADISRIEIERAANQVTVTVHTARPGIVIGRGGQRVDEMRLHLEEITKKRIRLNIQEIRQPELDAYLVASNIAHQMERRISHRRAMKQAISRAMESGAQGIKVMSSGRLSGSEYARKETLHQGRVPLHTLRADIDYAVAEARTTLGRTGVKVWIYKGDILPEREVPPIEELPPGGVVAWGEQEVAEVEAGAEGEEGLVAVGAVETEEEGPVAVEAVETEEEGLVAVEAVEKEEEGPVAVEAVEKEEEGPAAVEAVEKEEEGPAAVEAVEKEEEGPVAVEAVEKEEVAAVAVGDDVKQGEVPTAVGDRLEEKVAPAAESDEAEGDTAPVEARDEIAEDMEGEQESNEEAG